MAEESTTPRRDAQPAPWVFDVLLGLGVTLVVALFIAADVGQDESDGWAYLWAVGLGALMLVRRRYPVTVVVLSVALMVSYYAAGYPPIGVAVPLAAAVFSAAECGRTAAAIIASTAMIVISVAYRLAAGQDVAFVLAYELPEYALTLAGAIALGINVRSRRELRRQADEIAELVADRVAREAEQRVMSERLAIARELHDSVGHALTVVNLHAQVLEEALDRDDEVVRGSLQAITDTTSATFADVRRTVAGLRRQEGASRSPLRLSDLGSAVRPAEQAGLEVGTHVQVRSVLPPTVEAAIYRIVQESITNVVRHADASHVDVSVLEVDGAVKVSIVNDGTHAPASPVASSVAHGNGIAGMRERTQLLGGSFSVGPEGAGYAVRASLPLEVTS